MGVGEFVIGPSQISSFFSSFIYQHNNEVPIVQLHVLSISYLTLENHIPLEI